MSTTYKHKKGQFIDFEQKKHDVVVAIEISTYTGETCECETFTEYRVGLAITNPTDKFDYDLGLEIAKGKARKHTDVIVSSTPHRLPEAALEAIMDEALQDLQNNPGKYIGGYDKAKERFETKKRRDVIELKLSAEDKESIEKLKQSQNAVDYIKEFKVFG